MSDLISRQALLKALSEEVLITVKGANGETVMRFIRQVNAVIKKQPTICVIRDEWNRRIQ